MVRVDMCVQDKLEVETQLAHKTHVPLSLSSMSLFKPMTKLKTKKEADKLMVTAVEPAQ